MENDLITPSAKKNIDIFHYVKTISSLLYIEKWDYSNKHAEEILSRTVSPVFCIKTYNKFQEKIDSIVHSLVFNSLHPIK
jgi:pyruvate/oxaloacetate carboxyltransferase